MVKTDDTADLLADLLATLVSTSCPSREEFEPEQFLRPFSARLQRLIAHDRLVVFCLEEAGRTFTVLGEHPARELLHAGHDRTTFDRQTRYVVEEWAIRSVFAGEPMLVGAFQDDPRFARLDPSERRTHEGGMRSGLLVPLLSGGGRLIGVFAATSLEAHTCGEADLGAARQVAELIGPLIESIVLIQRERRRRHRLRAVNDLTRVLGGSLNVRDVFDRLAAAVRPILDFDGMSISLLSRTGREVEMLAEVHTAPQLKMPSRIPLDHFSFASRVEAGEVVMIHDARRELRPELPGDRLILDDDGRSCLVAPLWLGERVGGGLYFGNRRPSWFDGSDAEIATAIAAQLVLALQHQRLAEEQRRLALLERRARRLEARVEALREELGERYRFDSIIGRAPGLREALARAAKVAPTETTVLITGESGTGKELVARAIHRASPSADGPFLAVSCAALPETLLEAELFGHERGAFTGADRQKPGRFELAAGGTLFLDEIGELLPAVQVKLLRVLQEREFERVGGTTTLRADVRIIAATNRDLGRAVESGGYRADLYYRLNVFPIHLPALRERGDDVLLLAESFVRELGLRMGKGGAGLSRDAREALLTYAWPGNVRELQNAVERALIMSEGGLITAGQLGMAPGRVPDAEKADQSRATESRALPTGTSLAEWEKRLVLDALEKSRGNRSRAAKLLGLSRSQLYTRLKRFGLDL